MINLNGMELLKESEGFRSKPYLCSAGVATIGYGSTVYIDGTPVSLKDKEITKEEAIKLLSTNLAFLSEKLEKFLLSIPFKLNSNQFSALLCFAYNLGTGPIIKEGRSMHDAIKSRDHKKIADAFLLYNKYTDSKGVKQVSEGLSKRREAERALYLS